MEQQFKDSKGSEKKNTTPIGDAYAGIKDDKVEFRTVNLKYSSCCGCGCHTINVERVVEINSELQDGDTIKELHKDDKTN